jgi:predicted phosphodiesterase
VVVNEETTMIRIAVLSDIHGNLPALKAALSQIDDMGISHIVILGDLISDFYQYTHETIQLVRSTTAYVIRGNREGYMIHRSEHPEDTTWEQYRQFSENLRTYRELTTEDITYFQQLPRGISLDFGDGFSLHGVHGSPFSEFDLLYPDKQSLITRSLDAIPEKVLLCGHTHKSFHARIGSKIIVNPGSVGLNFEQEEAAEYAVIQYTDNEIQIRQMKAKYDYASFKKSCDQDNPWVHLYLKSMEDGINYNVRFIEEAKNRWGVFPIANAHYEALYDEWCATGII